MQHSALPMRHRQHLAHRRVHRRPQKTGVLGKRPVRLDNARMRQPFDHEFGIGRNQQLAAEVKRRRKPQRLADEPARRRPMAFGITQLDLGGNAHRRVMAHPEGDRTGLTALVPGAHVAGVVGIRIGKPGHAPRVLDPATLDGGIVDAGLRITSGRMRRGQVWPGIPLVLHRGRQPAQVHFIAVKDRIPHRRLFGRQGHRIDPPFLTLRPPGCRLAVIAKSQRRANQCAAGGEIRGQPERRDAPVGEPRAGHPDRRIAARGIQGVLQGRYFVFHRHRLIDAQDFIAQRL